jgi:hypothetical protein
MIAKILVGHSQIPHQSTDIEVLFDGLPELIDLELDVKSRMLY